MRHLLVTNDFPPKVGGIQSYLWELWRRLPPEQVCVLTTPYRGDEAFDRAQPFRIVRSRRRILLPTPAIRRQIREVASSFGAEVVVLDPALPLGLVGPRIGLPYAVVVHGAEVTVPARLPLSRSILAHVLRGAVGIIAAGSYPAAESARAAGGGHRVPSVVNVPPGVDASRFAVLDAAARRRAREALGLPASGLLVVSVSRLVPRKGMDVLIDAVHQLAPRYPDLVLAIAGAGRSASSLARRAARGPADVRFLGRVPESRLASLYGSADVFAMLCRNRWWGLEQEGFGIVFLEAAACGVPQVAGDSGGAAEAVLDGETGIVVARPGDPDAVAHALARLLDARELRERLGDAARARVARDFSYDVLADRLRASLDALATR